MIIETEVDYNYFIEINFTFFFRFLPKFEDLVQASRARVLGTCQPHEESHGLGVRKTKTMRSKVKCFSHLHFGLS